MHIDMNRRIYNYNDLFAQKNPNYDANWTDYPRHQKSFGGEEVDMQVLFARSYFNTKLTKDGYFTEVLAVDCLLMRLGTRITLYLYGDGRKEDGSDVQCISPNCLEFGQLAKFRMGDWDDQSINFSYFGNDMQGYPLLVGFKFKAVAFTNRVVPNSHNGQSFYNEYRFFDFDTRCSFMECIQGKEPKAIEDALAFYRQKSQERQTAYNRQSNMRMPQQPNAYQQWKAHDTAMPPKAAPTKEDLMSEEIPF